MPIQNFAGTAISNTYQRVVQTDGTYLADGTGSLINNLTLPGNLVVSGTLYAQNTIIVTQSFSSGSNILGDAANDFQTLYGTVRIPTGSFIVSGSSTFVNPATPYQISLKSDTTKVWSMGVGKAGYFQDWFLLNDGISDIIQINNSYTRINNILTISSSLGIGVTIPSAKLHISGASSDILLRIDSPATSSIIYVSGSGAVGFNQTSSLTSQATFRGISGNNYLTEINTTTNGAYGLRTDGPAKAAGYFFSNAGGGNILTVGGVSMMTFDSLLNVGIAVSSSIGARLHVRGSGTTSATNTLRIDNANASASLVVRDDGRVGVGTSSPSRELTVVDTTTSAGIAIDSSTQTNNFYIEASKAGLPRFSVYENSDVVYINSYNRMTFRANQLGGSGGNIVFLQGNVGIETSSPSYKLDVSGSGRFTSGVIITGSLSVSGSQNYTGDVNINGTLTATVKSFLINHPTQPGKRLQYGNLEGPEHGVYFRGKSTSNIIELPEEWIGLVDEETITVQLTSIGKHQPLYVEEIKDNKVVVGVSGWILSQPSLNYYYLIHGERKDVNKLITTIN